MKRWLALLLAAVMLFTTAPLSVFAQSEEPESTVDTDSVSVQGSNGFGTLLSEDLTEYQAEQEASDEDLPGGFAIVDLSVEGNTATVEYAVTEEANLIVSIYTEDGLQLLLSGHTRVTPAETESAVTLEGTMPQYFMVSAYMVDIFDYSPLCEAYSTPMYTKDMQDLLASTVDDYDQELVLNLDDSRETNFAVYAEDTIQIDAVPGVNTVAGIDDVNGIYVIENADATFTSLQVGDIFSYAYGDNEYLITKVADIEVDGTTVTITGGDLEMEEVFSHVKLETAGSTADVTVDESSMEDGVTYEGMTGGDVQTFAWDESISSKRYISYTLDKELKTNVSQVEMAVKVSGTARLGIETSLNYYISLKRQYVEFKTKLLFDLALGIEAEITADIPLGKYHISLLECIGIGLEPVIKIQCSAEITFRVSYSGTFGFRFENGSLHNISTPPEVEHEVEMEGTIFIGLDLAPNIFLFGGAVMEATMNVPFGVELKAKQTGTNITGIDETKSTIHGCTSCLECTISMVEEVSLKVNFLKLKRLTFGGTIYSHKINLGNFYWSIEHDDLGWGKCPYKEYRVSVYVKGLDGNALPFVEVTAQGKNGPYDTLELGQTNANGTLSCYLPPNTYDFVVKDNGDDVVATVKVEEPQKIYLNCNTLSALDILRDEVNIGAIIDNGTPIRTDQCGDNVTYEYYNIGLLKISGTGPMEDYSSESEQPWYDYADSVTMVVIEDGVTSVGSYAFKFCTQMQTLELPNSIVEINPFAFQACLGLTSLTIPNSVTHIYGYAFYACSGLAELVIPDSVKEIGMAGFAECNGLTEIYLPASVTRLGDSWLTSDNLTGYTVDPNNPSFKSIDGVLYNKSGTTLMLIPGQYEGAYHIPSGVTHIDGGAFECQAQLTEVYIPDTVTSIGYWAFKDCNALKTVVFQGDAPTISDEAFNGWSGNTITAYYPADNETWTADKMQNYGGTITWVANTVETVSEDPDGMDTDDLQDLDNLFEATAAAEENGEISTFGLWGGDYETEQTPDYDLKTATFSGLVAGEQYLMLCLVSIEAEDLLAPSNLLYVAQGTAAADGTLRITYVQRVDTELSYVIACGASHKNLKDATITFPTMVATGQLQVVEPTVIYGGKKLQEGVDYTISGIADYTAAGTYTCYIRGIYNYSGRVKCQYTVVELPVSGTCGEALTWTLSEDGVLTIVGSGPMAEFADETSAPWYACRDVITEVVIGRDVTSVSNYAFAGCTKLLKVSFLGNAPAFGEKAFAVVGFTANYPMYDPSWTDDVKQSYGGSVAWTGVEYPCEHTNTELVNVKTATCQEAGYTGDTVCKDCYKTIITGTAIAMLDHSYTDNVCVNCGTTKPILQVASGKCGYSLTWTYWDNGLLEISGSGEMYHFSANDPAPWTDYCASITAVAISPGTTRIGAYAFKNCAALTDVVVPDAVTAIGPGAFSGCSSLESITLPFVGGYERLPSSSSQTPLGYIFGTTAYDGGIRTYQYYNDNLMDGYYIPASLRTVTINRGYVTNSAFYDCAGLTEINLGAEVKGAVDAAFYGCSALQAIHVDPSNPYLCDDSGILLKKDLTKLYVCPSGYEGSYTVCDSVTTISSHAFAGCTKLTHITLGSGITEVDEYTFENCTGLVTADLGQSLTTIGAYAFSGCSSLTELKMPDSMETISTGALSGCSALKSLTIPAGVTAIGGSPLAGCSSLESLTIPFVGGRLKTPEDTQQHPFGSIFGTTAYTGGVATKQYYYANSTAGHSTTTYYIPKSLKSVTVTGGYILSGSFSYCTYIESITLGDSVQSIEEEAFIGCSALSEISIGSGVATIGADAFDDCAALEEIVIPGTVDSITGSVFSGCNRLKKIAVGSALDAADQTTALGNYVFIGCSALTDVYLGCGVNISGESVFPTGGSNFGNIEIAENNPYICCDDYGVLYTKDMKTLIYCPPSFEGSYTIPEGVTTVGPNAFSYCGKLTSVYIADTVTEIGESAFRNCTALSAIHIGTNVVTIGAAAFAYCEALTTITIPAKVTALSTAFYGCSGLKTVCFMGEAPSMGEYMFYGVTATAYYRPTSTWTYSVKQNYNGTITWVSTSSPCKHKQYVVRNAVEATCTEPGHSGEILCMGCLMWFDSGSEIPATGHSYQKETIDATCTAEGSAIYSCRNCDDMYTEVIAMLPHDYQAVVMQPTCTAGGYTTYTCSACSDTYTADETAAIPHNHEASLIVPPTCTEAGSTTYTCTGCSDSYTETVEKLGHSHEAAVTAPTCEAGGYTTYTCHCGDTYTADFTEAVGHQYEGLVCVNCGYFEPIQWVGTQLQATSNLDMQFALRVSDLKGTTGNYIVLTRTYADGREPDVVTIPQEKWTTSGNFYIVAYSGLAAKEMGDVISAVVYDANGNVISETRSESIVTYALSMLGKITNAEQKTMFVDLLNYGAEAQTFFGYNTANLANAGLTAEQKALGTQGDIEVADHRVKGANFFGSNLSLENVILLQMAFKVTPADGMYAMVTYTNHNGKEVEEKLEIIDNNGYSMISINSLAIADYRTLVTCTLYDAGGNVVGSAVDSMESYVARSQTDLGKAIMRFGASAYAYFH